MSATWSVRWLDLARQDYADILRWTALHFGPRQAEIYTETIALAVETLDTGPDIPGGVQRDDLAPGIFTLHVARNGRKARHFEQSGIDVLRHCRNVADACGRNMLRSSSNRGNANASFVKRSLLAAQRFVRRHVAAALFVLQPAVVGQK